MTSPTDWQTSCPNIKTRMGHLFETKLWTDVEFLVGPKPNAEKIRAHKLVLSASSPVFETMFNGKFTESNDALIPIPDLNLPEFEKTLRFIYTDECIIASVDEAISLFYASKKYMLDKLGKQSITFITCCINPENVLKAYEFATFNEDTELMASCIKLMAARTKEYIQTKSFVNSDLNSVIALFGQKNLAIDSELDLVRALEKYAAYNKCDFRTDAVDTKKSTQDVDVTPSEKLPTIHDAVKHIRWLTFLPSEIAPVLSETKLLTEQEKLDILLNVCSKNAKRAIPAGFDTARESRGSVCRTCKKPCLSKSTFCSVCYVAYYQTKLVFGNCSGSEGLYPAYRARR